MQFFGSLVLISVGFLSLTWAQENLETTSREEVQLAAYSTVPSDQPIRLGSLTEANSSLKNRFGDIADVELFESRLDGERFFVSRVEMARKIQSQIDSHDFIFKIPNQIVVEAKRNFISAVDVSRQIVAQAMKDCGSCEVKIKDLRVPEIKSNLKLISWEIDLSQSRAAGSMLIPLKVKFQGENQKIEQQTFWAQAQVNIEKEALVARKNLKAGDRIQASDYELRKMNFTYEKEAPLRESEVQGQALARFIMAGQAFKAGDIKREPAAQRGQILKVIGGLGSGDDSQMEVSIQATAEENGFIGDVIRVKNTESQKILSGQVVEKGVVRIQ